MPRSLSMRRCAARDGISSQAWAQADLGRCRSPQAPWSRAWNGCGGDARHRESNASIADKHLPRPQDVPPPQLVRALVMHQRGSVTTSSRGRREGGQEQTALLSRGGWPGRGEGPGRNILARILARHDVTSKGRCQDISYRGMTCMDQPMRGVAPIRQ